MALPALAGEGKWTPQQVLAQGPAWVAAQGFGLPLGRLWDEKAGSGLLANAVQLPGCSGGFISAEGLLITNHHCADGILQERSTRRPTSRRTAISPGPAPTRRRPAFPHPGAIQAFRDVTQDVLRPPCRQARPTSSASTRWSPGRRRSWRSARRRPARAASSRSSTAASSSLSSSSRRSRTSASSMRAAPGCRQLRGRGGQLELAAAHRRLLAPAGLQGRPAVSPAALLPGFDRGRPRGRRRRRPRLPGPFVPLVDRRRDG